MKRRKEVGRLDIENPKCKWHKTVYLEDGKLMKTIHDGSFTPVEPEPEMLPLYFEGRQVNSLVGLVSTLETPPNLEWSYDNENWQSWRYSTVDGEHRFDELLLYAIGDRIYVRGDNLNGLGYSDGEGIWQNSTFVLTGAINGGGNVMSLLDTTMELTEVPDYGLYLLLCDLTGGEAPVPLLTAPDMSTITIIGKSGCGGMYENCTSLTSAASMPALTSIGNDGCNGMYSGCTSLTSAASMPALTSIGNDGCNGMYLGCTSLTSAASMPALTSIGNDGCNGMYSGCTFDMSDDGNTLNFAFPTPPVTAGETTYDTAYDVANWMGNTNGFGGDNQ